MYKHFSSYIGFKFICLILAIIYLAAITIFTSCPLIVVEAVDGLFCICQIQVNGRAVLMWAAQLGSADCARVLLEAGADKEVVDDKVRE